MITMAPSYGHLYDKLIPGTLDSYFKKNFEDNFYDEHYSFIRQTLRPMEVNDYISSPIERLAGHIDDDLNPAIFLSDEEGSKKFIRVVHIPSVSEAYLRFRKSSIDLGLTP